MVKKPDLRDIPEAVQLAYAERLSNFKKAKVYLQNENIPKSVEQIQKYLQAVAAYKGVQVKELHPDQFKDDGHVSEQLLISYAYWDLAKAYDGSEKFEGETERLLKQFVLFTMGFKYQYNHSIMVRKYLRLNKAKNRQIFQAAYDKVYVKTKGCFVATYAFHENHFVVEELRKFRDGFLLKYEMGENFVDLYYRYSPHVVTNFQSLPLSGVVKNIVIRPIILILYSLVLILRKLFHVF